MKNLLIGGVGSPEKMFLEFLRHNPVLVTGAVINGRIRVNKKVVGCGYVVKRDLLKEVS